jgi:nicotinamide phosphoribosyltransferase
MYNKNIVLDTDSYKVSHFAQYPENTQEVYSYVESRGGEYPYTVFFGLQALLKNLEENPITMQNVFEAALFFKKHGLEFNLDGWAYIARDLKGKLPLRINAVSEGSVLKNGTVLMTVVNTDPKCFWLTSWMETYLLRLWYPTTVCTQSHAIRQLIMEDLQLSSDNPEAEINFKLHDFGSRGVSSPESAALGGAAHLVNFMGSDTVLGVDLANRVYKHDMAAFSIPAAEHSTITSWGLDGEDAAYDNMLNKFAKPGSLVAVVSDSYDLEHAVKNIWGKTLRDKVVESGATVIIRPDSGHPATMVLQTLQNLERGFGSTVNKKGFKVLNHVRVIQGDGINQESIKEILDWAHMAGFSATNIAFGMGGALLQQVNRDTQKFAYKCSSITIDGQHRDVFKCPKDAPFKKSKAGRFENDLRLQTVFLNGSVVKEYTLDEIRERAKDLTGIQD